MVIVLDAHEAVTPAGRPSAVPIPVAPDVVCVIAVNAILLQSVGVNEAAPAVFDGVTVIIPVALALSQSPVNGIE